MSIRTSPNPTKNNIRVGYIDPELGYIDSVSIRKANIYAKNNPGTLFIFTDGDNNVNYLNIDQVNQLTGQELLSTKPCKGIENKSVQPPIIQFSGGGGIGALGNAVIGEDGSILAVDLEYGGNGYQYPPTVYANDFSGSGSGAVFRVTLSDGTGDPVTVLDCSALDQILGDYGDFEDFEDNVIDFGRVYTQNGQDIGPWDPKSYLNVSSNDVQEFIDVLNSPSPSNPAWDTRSDRPDRIISTNPSRVNTSTSYNVSDSRWADFLNKYAISPIPPSNVRGSDHSGIVYIFEWENNFPTTGKYIFRGTCDNIAVLYIDNIKQTELQGLEGSASPIVTPTITQGIHKIRVDLVNEIVWPDGYQEIKSINFGLFRGEQSVFNTVDFIDRANRTLWRANPYGRGGLLSSHGICPFDNVNLVVGEDYVGTHIIIWNNISFPQSREYRIRIEVDDSVVLKIGDNIIIPKTGTGTLDQLQNIPQGNYNITAELTQRLSFKSINPVALAVDISIPGPAPRTDVSYNTNPVAVSMSIDYPKPIPPIPTLPPTPQDSPCPPNPFWSTRFPTNRIESPLVNIQRLVDRTTSVTSVVRTVRTTDVVPRNNVVPDTQNQWYPAIHPFWSVFMNRYAISPVPPLNSGDDAAGIVFRNSWTIDAPYSGVYGFRGTADNIGKFFVDGEEIARLQSFRTERPETIRFTLSKGIHIVTIEVVNIPLPVRLPTPLLTSSSTTWGGNPIGISAIIIAPCCPKKVGGKGVVIEVIPEEPGNNYLPPRSVPVDPSLPGVPDDPSLPGVPSDPTYPVSLELEDVIIADPGINYSPEDPITITPDNGASLEFETDNFGRITNVNVLTPGFGFTTYPTIRISTASGGVNAKFIPKFKIIRDPIVVDESRLIQVTDLVGIKQTGYIDGRPYFGAVFYENNIKYAGYYETIGDLVQVYDTLKESIDAQVTTPSSAIQRQGTDVTSNDPRLNIPGTPQNLI
jgi:hypothetical protein